MKAKYDFIWTWSHVTISSHLHINAHFKVKLGSIKVKIKGKKHIYIIR